MGRGLGRIQKAILRILKSEEREWVGLNTIIIKTYHPYQLDREKARERGYFDWSYSDVERKITWRSVKALERRGLVRTRIIRYINKEKRRKVRGGLRRWMEVQILNVSQNAPNVS